MAEYNNEKEIEKYLKEKQFKKIKRIYFDNNIYSDFYINSDFIIILDNNICDIINNKLFDYSLYTTSQNEIIQTYNKPYFRFLNSEKVENIDLIVYGDIDLFQSYGNYPINRSGDNSYLETLFESAFITAFGKNALTYLHKEYPILSTSGTTYFIDYVVELTSNRIIGFELNGVNYHHPQIIGSKNYKKQLEKQNLCNKLSIDLFRLSYDQCVNTEVNLSYILQDIVKNISNLKPKKLLANRNFNLYEHQEGALEKLKELHKEDNSSIVIVLPTAAGKTQIIIEDLINYFNFDPNNKVGIFTPTLAIKDNWIRTIKKNNLHNFNIEIGTYHLLNKLSREKECEYFDYIIVDEAHHAVANCTKNALSKFKPKLLVGLTATTQRLDNKKLEDVFNCYSTNLTLKEAMDKNIIAKARAYRIETNLDLSNIRYNNYKYNSGDLEKKISVDSRNILIGELLLKYFNDGSLGVIFCVSIKHAQELASLLKNRFNLNAKAISSKDGDKAKNILNDFHNQQIQFLCVCDLLNEGWDEPNIKVLVMARPTLSKVLYTQQLGRGLRRTKEKEEVYIIDVIDKFSYACAPYSLHALFNNSNYLPWGYICENDNQVFNNKELINVNGIYETITNIVSINIDTLDKQLEGLLSVEAAARELYLGTGTFKKWIKKYKIQADKILKLGNTELQFFSYETIEKIRRERNLIVHDDSTLKSDFFSFIEENDYTFSFKMVFLKESIKLCDCNGQINLDQLIESYRNFYINRINENKPVDKKGCIYSIDFLNNKTKVKQSILKNPFEKFERKRFFEYNNDLNKIAMNYKLWTQLNQNDKNEIVNIMNDKLVKYYNKLDG
ncbi:MAG: DEAD/DEAH box helicase [Spirochaetia bacterium]|nr:DEAD/DEAH box helicase [Spirochaetia bacterium]